jgi:serine protease Do
VGWFGAHVEPPVMQRGIRPVGQPDGVLVSTTNSGGPAAAAGIRGGDRILNFQSVPVSDARGMEKLVTSARNQRQVSVRISRGGDELTVLISNPFLAAGPPNPVVRHAQHHGRRGPGHESDTW